MAYAVANIVKFVFDNRRLIGPEAPHIIARAFRTLDKGGGRMLMSGSISEMMGASINLEQQFQGAAQSAEHMLLWEAGMQGKPTIDIAEVVLALCGEDVPREIGEPAVTGKIPDNYAAKLGALLRTRGVDWEDKWIAFK